MYLLYGIQRSRLVHEWKNDWMNKRANKRTNGRTDGWMNKWMDGQMGGWMDEWMKCIVFPGKCYKIAGIIQWPFANEAIKLYGQKLKSPVLKFHVSLSLEPLTSLISSGLIKVTGYWKLTLFMPSQTVMPVDRGIPWQLQFWCTSWSARLEGSCQCAWDPAFTIPILPSHYPHLS